MGDQATADELQNKIGTFLSWMVFLVIVCLIEPARPTDASEPSGRLQLAICQFPVSANIAENGAWIRRQMQIAKQSQATLVHFPECALSGYAGVDHDSLDKLDWKQLHQETKSILELADQLDLWVVVGTTHRLTEPHKPHNSLYVITPDGNILDRYDKRFCTGGDLKHYSPGDHFVTFEVNGVRCGLLICYDIRFPELYRAYCKQGVRLMLHSFYNARQKPGSIHPKIMPPTAQAYAAANNMFVSINNSSAAHSWPSRFITPDGLIQASLPVDQPGVMVQVVDVNKKYYDASAPYRMNAINGVLHSGEPVADPRSEDRQSY